MAGRTPCFCVLKDAATTYVDKRWVVRRFNIQARTLAPGTPIRFDRRAEAEAWVLQKVPWATRCPAERNDDPSIVVIFA